MTELAALSMARDALVAALRSIGCRAEAAGALKEAIDVLDVAIGREVVQVQGEKREVGR